MDVLRIVYECGSMELWVQSFFPCNLQTAKKVAKFINRGCTEEDRSELLLDLHTMAETYQRNIEEAKDLLSEFKRFYAAMGTMAKPDFNEMKRCESKIRKNETLKIRVEKNISLIEEGEKNGKI